MPVVGGTDLFEQRYTTAFRQRLSDHGQFVRYENDRAALDLGLHLYDDSAPVGTLGQVRVWFQLKGISASSLSRSEVLARDHVPVSGLPLEHMTYWFAHAEPVYLAVFVEAIDSFLVADIRDLVEPRGGLRWLTEAAARGQKSTTVQVPIAATVDVALAQMPRHQSMRLDGPPFRGRPLGHRLDPLRCELDQLPAHAFDELAERLLAAHEFRPTSTLDSRVFGDIGTVRAEVGRLYLTYEWTCPLFTEFGFDPDSDFRIESQPLFAHGDVLVIVHSEVEAAPRKSESLRQFVGDLRSRGVDEAIIMFNGSEGQHAAVFGGWRAALEPLAKVPQGLGSLAFNLLTATSIYFEFLDRVSWRTLNYR